MGNQYGQKQYRRCTEIIDLEDGLWVGKTIQNWSPCHTPLQLSTKPLPICVEKHMKTVQCQPSIKGANLDPTRKAHSLSGKSMGKEGVAGA